MVLELGPGVAMLLVAISFLAGIGITAIGPGGIFLTIALYSLTSLSSAGVAGTSSATMIAAGVVGTLAYVHSGELKERSGRTIAVVLSLSGLVGGIAGSGLNALLLPWQFGVLLSAVAVGVGVVIVYQEWRGMESQFHIDAGTWTSRAVLAIVGLGIGIVSGVLGVGGPVFAVPALVLLGVPIVASIAVAQVQSIFIAVFATAGYVIRDAVAWPLVLVVGIPLLAGVLIGWMVSHRVDPRRLKVVLGITLIAVGPYIAFQAWS